MTHRENVLNKLGLPLSTHLSLEELSKYTKVPLKALQEVFHRGEGAWGNNLASVRLKSNFSKNPNTSQYPRGMRLSKNQWAYARVYSFLDKGKDYYTADQDIAKKYNLLKNINEFIKSKRL